MRYRTILLFGAPGSGKGTQGKILGTVPNFFHCACGDVFRNLTIDSEIGRIFVKFSSQGKLVPDKYTVRLWREKIEAQTRSGRFQPAHDTLVLDGIPRNVHQAKMLRRSLDVVAVIYLVCGDMKKLVERLQRRALRENRLDDAQLDVIHHRLKVYEQETKPVLEFYGERLVHRVDSSQSPTEVLRHILDLIAAIR